MAAFPANAGRGKGGGGGGGGTASEVRENAVATLASAAILAAPYATVATAGSVAWAVASCTFQACAGAARIHAAVPLVATAAGAVGVAAASAGSGAAGVAVVAEAGKQGSARRAVSRYLESADEILADALLGLIGFRLVGGRFCEMLPSDLCFPGAMARESLRAPGQSYADNSARRELGMLFRRHGCHHCGRKTGEFVGDHMPPNKIFNGNGGPLKTAWQRALYGLSRPGIAGIKQRYFPQCRPCSQLQASAVSRNVMTLRMHRGFLGPSLLVGAMTALRHFGYATRDSTTDIA